MTAGSDSGLSAALLEDEELAAFFASEAEVQAMLAAEAALARVEGRAPRPRNRDRLGKEEEANARE